MTPRLTVGAAIARLAEVRRAELQALEDLAKALAVESPEVRVSQRTSERVLGIPRRPFLELAREYAAAGGECIAIGKLRSVSTVDFEAWLRRRSAAVASAPASDENTLASELGLVAVGGGR